jgi:acyl carrier protein
MNDIDPVDTAGMAVLSLVCQTFRCLPAQVSRNTQADDVDGWDSLSHGVLMVAIERHFAVRLEYADFYNASDVGTLIDYIRSVLPR